VQTLAGTPLRGLRGRRVPKHDAFNRAFNRLTPVCKRALRGEPKLSIPNSRVVLSTLLIAVLLSRQLRMGLSKYLVNGFTVDGPPKQRSAVPGSSYQLPVCTLDAATSVACRFLAGCRCETTEKGT
jgi:hypothetical protein